MHKLCHFACALALVLTLQSCALSQVTTKTVTVESYQTQCTTSYPFFQTLCLVIIEPNGETQSVTDIGGFDYEWGYRYRLVIEETEPDPGLQDAPSVFRELERVVSREKVAPGTPFEMRLATVLPARDVQEGMSRQLITQEAPQRFAFFKESNGFNDASGREFTCDMALCEDFRELIAQELELTIEFAHPETPTQPLIARRIISKEALPDFY